MSWQTENTWIRPIFSPVMSCVSIPATVMSGTWASMVGDETFVHAANSISGVVTTSLSTGYYATRGYEIRRIVG